MAKKLELVRHIQCGNALRYNVAQLEQWARDQKIEDTGSKVIDTLLPIIQVSGIDSNLEQSFVLFQLLISYYFRFSQATQLLQARKSEEDVIGICDM